MVIVLPLLLSAIPQKSNKMALAFVRLAQSPVVKLVFLRPIAPENKLNAFPAVQLKENPYPVFTVNLQRQLTLAPNYFRAKVITVLVVVRKVAPQDSNK